MKPLRRPQTMPGATKNRSAAPAFVTERELPSPPAAGGASRIPIEELARRTGTTVRNLRKLQSFMLLDPPELVGRKGFYTERHVARVVLVRRLQERGYSLASIQELFQKWQSGGGLMDVFGLEDSLVASSPSGSARAAPLGDDMQALTRSPVLLRKAIQLELIVRRDGQYLAPNAELLAIFREHVDAGIPISVVLDESLELKKDAERIAARFRRTFAKYVTEPFVKRGFPASELPVLGEKVARLRPSSVRAAAIHLANAIERGERGERGVTPAADQPRGKLGGPGPARGRAGKPVARRR